MPHYGITTTVYTATPDHAADHAGLDRWVSERRGGPIRPCIVMQCCQADEFELRTNTH